MKKRFLSLTVALVFLLSLLLTSCSSFSGKEDTKTTTTQGAGAATGEEKVFRVSIGSDAPNLDPALIGDNISNFVSNQVFQTLTQTDKEGNVVPDAAEKVEHNEDYSVWTYTLRDGLKFSNGDPLTAETFRDSWLRVLSPETASGQAERFFPIVGAEEYNKGEGEATAVGIEAKDDKTFVVTLKTGNAFFDAISSYANFAAVDTKLIADNKDWTSDPANLIGSGPYVLESYDLGQQMTFVKNPNYFDIDNVDVDKISVEIIQDENTVYQKFKAGELDFVGQPVQTIPTDQMEEAKNDPSYRGMDQLSIYWYKINTEDELMKNVHLRKALAYSINRQSIIDNITKNGAKPAMGYVPQFDTQGFKDNDVEAAKAELQTALTELGISDPNEITIKLSYNTSEAHQKIAQAVQETWKNVLGINAELKNEEWQVYLDTLKAMNFQVGRLGWGAETTDPADFLNMYLYKEGENNQTLWHSDAFNAKVEEANKHFADPEMRNKLLKEAEGIMLEEMPVIPLYFAVYPSLTNTDRVDTVDVTVLGNLFVKDVKLK